MIRIRFFPKGKEITIEKSLTVKQLLKRLNLIPQTALVIKKGRILTSDKVLKDGDEVEIRPVGSRG